MTVYQVTKKKKNDFIMIIMSSVLFPEIIYLGSVLTDNVENVTPKSEAAFE